MSIDDLAVRLDAAAAEFAVFKAELDRGEPAFDTAGPGAQQVAALLTHAWQAQTAAAGGLAAEAAELAANVRAAAAGYRESDKPAQGQWRAP